MVKRINRNNVSVSIHVEGKSVPIYKDSNGVLFIEGAPGRVYSIVVENTSTRRIEICASVDGTDTLRPEPANWNNRGMVVSAQDTWNNNGWRLNDKEIAEFKFSDPDKSMAQAVGNPQNIGVIGIAVFNEAHKTMQSYYMTDFPSRCNPSRRGLSLGMDEISEKDADIGTGYGDIRQDTVGHTTFMRTASAPETVIEIQYRTRKTLEKMGLLHAYPQAFTNGNSPNETGFRQFIK